MARKKPEEEHDNHERWMVSYADFITLLFAFFVVMYSLSSINESKYRLMSNSILEAFGRGSATKPVVFEPSTGGVPAIPPKPLIYPGLSPTEVAIKREREQLTKLMNKLLVSLEPLIKEGKVNITQTGRGISVDIKASVLFAEGDAILSGQAIETLAEVAEVLKKDKHAIQIEGHTDSTPIFNDRFPSNWELSAMRAISVVRVFIAKGIGENRLQAAAFAATSPIDTNETEAGRQRNRRVHLLILSNVPETVTDLPLRLKPKK